MPRLLLRRLSVEVTFQSFLLFLAYQKSTLLGAKQNDSQLWLQMGHAEKGNKAKKEMTSRKAEETYASGQDLKGSIAPKTSSPSLLKVVADSFSFPAWTHAQLFSQDPAPMHMASGLSSQQRDVEFSVVGDLAPSASGECENVASTALNLWNSKIANQSATGLNLSGLKTDA